MQEPKEKKKIPPTDDATGIYEFPYEITEEELEEVWDCSKKHCPLFPQRFAGTPPAKIIPYKLSCDDEDTIIQNELFRMIESFAKEILK